MKLSGNKILITGATSGIGEALLKRFLDLDNEIIAVGRNQSKLDQLAQQSPSTIPYKCDLANIAEVIELADFVKAEHPDLNILINNAGIQYNYSFSTKESRINEIEEELKINLISPAILTQVLFSTLAQNNSSAIVNVSSALGIVPKKEAAVYCASKAGLHLFSKALRYDAKKVKVFEIIPSLVETNMTKGRGKGKITPNELVAEFIKAFNKDKLEINIGKVKLLRLIHRISPQIAQRIINK
jgi:short-subunit dehydrogenase involved in D-alanine esterification of teichoic acids